MQTDLQAFISYAHIDNRPVLTELDGWVTLLHKTLKNYLDRLLGREVDIWRDDRLERNQLFWDEIAEKLARTAVLVAVLSPRYIASTSCANEFRRFCEIAERKGGLVVGNRSRIFKVLTLPMTEADFGTWQPLLKNMLAYEFYEPVDHQTSIELAPMYGEHSKAEFLRRVAVLATGIAKVVKELEGTTPKLVGRERSVVYLATCSHDRARDREIVMAELNRLDCTVLPDHTLPMVESDLLADVRPMLARSRLAIHLIGSGYGMTPDGTSGKSAAMLQNELAVQRCREAGLQRIVWLPEETVSTYPAQATFIDALRRDANTQFGADLIAGNLETLKAALAAALKRLDQPPAAKSATAKRKQLSLVCCADDRKHLVKLIRLLQQLQVDVNLPLFSGASGEVREANHSQLMDCDAALLYYGDGDEVWKLHQTNELRRVRGLRGTRGLAGGYTVVAAPNNDDKDLLVALDPHCIDVRAGLTPAVHNAVAAMLRDLFSAGTA